MHVTAEDFKILHEACTVLDTIGIPYVIGGGTAVVEWGRNRRTKDFDIFLNREVLRPAMDALSKSNFLTTDTEKRWLYKVWRGETLIDFIVESRGGIRIDDDAIKHAVMMTQYGYEFRLMGPEDTLYRKALTLTEGRPDWYDGISIIDRQRDNLDWTYFLYLSQRYPRRILGFLLFAQTELHHPADAPSALMDNFLYDGGDPGPVPEWVIFTLVKQLWLSGERSPRNPYMLEYHLPEAA